jgi:hypothetical protein
VTIGPGQSYDLPPIKADVTDAFKALAALNDTQLLRALRALPAEKRFVLNMNVDQVDGLGIDGNRIRHFSSEPSRPMPTSCAPPGSLTPSTTRTTSARRRSGRVCCASTPRAT